jgi:hypothetical protein
MINLNEEYFESPYYFFCKDKGDNVAVYFSVADTISESRKEDDVVIVDKDVFEDIQKVISKIMNSGKKVSKEYIHKMLDSKAKKKETPDGELDELVNPDGSVISSSIPILNQRNLAKKTMDQTVRMTKSNQFPFIRIYYGESEENKPVIDEEDMSGAFAKEETENDRTYNECMKSMEELGVEDYLERDERCKVFGFDKKLDKELKQEKKQGECKNCFTKRRLSELEKQKMEKMIDEILLSKKSNDKEVVKKKKENKSSDSVIEKLLIRNIESIKRLADKEDVDIDKLIKHLKTGE